MCVFILFSFFVKSRMSPGKIVFGVVPSKNGKESGLSSLCFNDKPMNFFYFCFIIFRTGEVNIELKYPDSITEWMIQAIGLTPNNGVCISEPLNVTAFRDFFLQLNLPYQAVRMEHIDVDVTVFMYGESGANSTVIL